MHSMGTEVKGVTTRAFQWVPPLACEHTGLCLHTWVYYSQNRDKQMAIKLVMEDEDSRGHRLPRAPQWGNSSMWVSRRRWLCAVLRMYLKHRL